MFKFYKTLAAICNHITSHYSAQTLKAPSISPIYPKMKIVKSFVLCLCVFPNEYIISHEH